MKIIYVSIYIYIYNTYIGLSFNVRRSLKVIKYIDFSSNILVKLV